MARYRTLDDFWPYYMSEHRNAASRRLHFVGTSAWLGSLVASTVVNPVGFPLAMVGMVAIGADAVKREGKAPSLPHLLAMIALPTIASPVLFPAGVVAAYGCAWAGHFGIEKNRPATFQYPVMSLASDLRLYGNMLRGRYWTGDPGPEVAPAP